MNGTSNGHETDHRLADQGHHRQVARPHREDEGLIADAEEVAAQMRSAEHPFGSRGRRFERSSQFYLGLMASAGVGVTYGVVRLLGSASSPLVLIGAALFFALGLEPAVSSLLNRKLPRWAAVTLVVVVVFGVAAGSVAAVIPALVEQAHQFIEHAPHYLQQAQNHSSVIGRLNERFHLQQRITDAIHSGVACRLAGLSNSGKRCSGPCHTLGLWLC